MRKEPARLNRMRNKETDSNQNETPRKGLRLLGEDLKNNWLGIAVSAGYVLFFQLVFTTICPMQLLFGLPCPGCGLTRAAMLLLKGQVKEAYGMHPFLFVGILLLLYWGFFRYILGKKAKGLLLLTALVCIAMLLFYIYRMYLYYPDIQPMNPLTEGWVPGMIHHMKTIYGVS